jgi:hypothetical protein
MKSIKLQYGDKTSHWLVLYLNIVKSTKGARSEIYSLDTYVFFFSFSSTNSAIWSQSRSSEFSVFWMVWFMVFSMSWHTSSIWFAQELLFWFILGIKMVGISNPVRFRLGRLHSSCTICIRTLWKFKWRQTLFTKK